MTPRFKSRLVSALLITVLLLSLVLVIDPVLKMEQAIRMSHWAYPYSPQTIHRLQAEGVISPNIDSGLLRSMDLGDLGLVGVDADTLRFLAPLVLLSFTYYLDRKASAGWLGSLSTLSVFALYIAIFAYLIVGKNCGSVVML